MPSRHQYHSFSSADGPSMQSLRIIPFLAVLAIILFTGLKPEPVPQVFDQQDKLHHLLGFAALAFSVRLAFPSLRLLWTVALCLAAAIMIELAQGYQPHRDASVADMVANTLGVAVGCVCLSVGRRLYDRWARRGRPLSAVDERVESPV
ncbi:VanZ family protein [Stutzerimonas azotifigens]|uniref:VanZ family protein n=1 Tax=Stutzerimonas azotifigens TaxID=291995 RepID=UPI001F19FFBB